MAVIETFHWCVRLDSTGAVDEQILSAQFGDGYEQVAGVGINSGRAEWQVNVRMRKPAIDDVYEFLSRHGQKKAFLWEPPMGVMGLYRRSSAIRISGQGRGMFTLSTSFKQFYKP